MPVGNLHRYEACARELEGEDASWGRHVEPRDTPMRIGMFAHIMVSSTRRPLLQVLVALKTEGPRGVTELVGLVTVKVGRIDLLHQPPQGIGQAALGALVDDSMQRPLGCFFGSIHSHSKAKMLDHGYNSSRGA